MATHRHPGAGRGPGLHKYWIPACAGMTDNCDLLSLISVGWLIVRWFSCACHILQATATKEKVSLRGEVMVTTTSLVSVVPPAAGVVWSMGLVLLAM